MSVSPCKALHLQYTLRPACYKTNKSISLRPESIDLHKELLYDHFRFYCHAMFPQTTWPSKDHLFPRRTHCYKKLLCIFLRDTASPNSLRSASCKMKPVARVKSTLINYKTKPAATESSGSWFTVFRGRITVIALAWNHLVQIRLVLTWRFTQLVETRIYI